ncbi:hypothetical protein [Agathobaculum butyriciproducens]|uniref:hypothetical protein n=1 Tax=Agathobaculum butyriciproducens TaxID=1628085 RepID=UPI0036D409CE
MFYTRKDVHYEHNHVLSAQTENQIVPYGIAQMVLDRLLSGGTLQEFYLPQNMPMSARVAMHAKREKCAGTNRPAHRRD